MSECLLDRKVREAGGPQELVKKLGARRVIELTRTWGALARPEQIMPGTLGAALTRDDWDTWYIQAGRFWGKTRTGAEATIATAKWAARLVQQGKLRAEEAEIHLVGPTAADVRDVMVSGPAGILRCSTPEFPARYRPASRRIDWPHGVYALLFSGQEPDRLRGPQGIFAWCDELPAWQYPEDCWDNLQFGLRLGPNPRTVVTTTPRPIKLIKDLLKDRGTVLTRGVSRDNEKNVAAKALARLYEKYGGTRLGRQELDGDLLDDNVNALWRLSDLDRLRFRPKNEADLPPDPGWEEGMGQGFERMMRSLPGRAARVVAILRTYGVTLERVVVAVDPAVSNNPKSDETGIVVYGVARCGCQDPKKPVRHGFVLEDASGRYSPSEWGALVVALYNVWEANKVVAEINNGGALVEANLRATNGGRNIPYLGIHAKKGKQLRAEPIAGLTEQGKEHHVGTFAKLEDESTTWDPKDPTAPSPNRLDAKVYGATDLMIENQKTTMWDVPASAF